MSCAGQPQTAQNSRASRSRAPASDEITLRTENYPRPGSASAVYYIYERNNEIICTKLDICDQYSKCTSTYHRGAHKDNREAELVQSYGQTTPLIVLPAQLSKHRCLKEFNLIN